ncbi:MAG: hypothetical protein Q8K63_10220 [Acidimicrobiales bacterium]|nr:hypothetical protein [Acidimicrobiales bacterium]
MALWDFSVVCPGAEWALYAGLGLRREERYAWWWTVVARVGEPLLLVRDDTLALPKSNALEVRGSGLWADLHCHEPMQRWQVNFEGFALALDPSDVGGDERGEPVAIEFEFEWDGVAAPTSSAGGGYEQVCMVDGEIQIGPGGPVLSLAEPVIGWRSERP